MSKAKTREQLEGEARALIHAQGSPGIMIELYVMLANDVQHLGRAVGEVRGILIVLVPLTVAILAFTGLTFFT